LDDEKNINYANYLGEMTAEEDEEAVNGKKLLLGGVDAKERSGGSDSDDWRADFKKGKQK